MWLGHLWVLVGTRRENSFKFITTNSLMAILCFKVWILFLFFFYQAFKMFSSKYFRDWDIQSKAYLKVYVLWFVLIFSSISFLFREALLNYFLLWNNNNSNMSHIVITDFVSNIFAKYCGDKHDIKIVLSLMQNNLLRSYH